MPHMAEIVVPDNGVYYLLSTSCDPDLFDNCSRRAARYFELLELLEDKDKGKE